jgi:NADH-quinone oxidoreductase subunit N
MTGSDFIALLPYITLSVLAVVIMLVIAFYRNHRLTVFLALAGFALAAACFPEVFAVLPRSVTPLFTIDRYALYYAGLIIAAGFSVAALSYSYFEKHEGHPEEFYLLLVLATLGCAVLAAASHFASFFLGIELLSVSLYALAAYLRHSDRSVEAGVKYLILAAVSSAFILFGMALVYAATGSLAFFESAARAAGGGLTFSAGVGLIIVGVGFKLAVVPFHLWTPDVYEGAPSPVTAFIATASKGAVFALVLRYFTVSQLQENAALVAVVTVIAVASMFAGNLLALLQTNVKRILAYSSISHLGYLLVTVLATGPMASASAAFYLAAYFLTTLGAFGVVTVLSGAGRDADRMEDYQGLAWRRPWLAGIFAVMLFSLAGIPMTAGFVGKFYVVAAGVDSALWIAVLALAINSVLGLFYYLRIIGALFNRVESAPAADQAPSRSGYAVLALLTTLLVWLGVYPGPMLALIKMMTRNLI